MTKSLSNQANVRDTLADASRGQSWFQCCCLMMSCPLQDSAGGIKQSGKKTHLEDKNRIQIIPKIEKMEKKKVRNVENEKS